MGSYPYSKQDIKEIEKKAELGRYLVRGYGSDRDLPNFDDLVVLPAQLSRLVIDSYREACQTETVLGSRFAKRPLHLKTPIIIAAMSYGALGKKAKLALAKAATMVGTADHTGEGGMMPEERKLADKLFYQCLPGRYGFTLENLLSADVIEILIAQGAKPGLGGHLMAEKVTPEIAELRMIPPHVDLRSPSRHPDVLGADDLVLKIEELREATDWQVPISIKIAAGRVKEDVKLAAKCGADIIAIDGMSGGTGAGPMLTKDHVGIPLLPAIPMAVEGLEEAGLSEEVDLIVMGSIRNGADAAKALALGADAVAIGSAALIAMGCTVCKQCHTGKCPAGICTHEEKLLAKLDIDEAAQKVANFITAMTQELTTLTKIAGKTNIHNLEPEDLRALTIEASRMARVPLVGE